MKKNVFIMTFCVVIATSPVIAGTVAYWRFEEGPANVPVAHPVSDGVYHAAVADSSGNGNELSVWNEGWAGYTYQTDTAYPMVLQTGAANHFSVRTNGPSPSMWTNTSDPIRSISPAAFTIEATFKLANGDYRTLIGRDSYGTATTNAALAALYFQATPGNGVAIKFCDAAGYWHEAVSGAGVIKTFDSNTNPNGVGISWYSMAAVSNGQTLSLYLANHDAGTGYWLVAQTNLTLSGSPNRALTAGAGDGSDWDSGNWSVGRGLYNGVHGDRALGLIDEVRISNAALSPSAFLASPNNTGTAAYWRFEEGPAGGPVSYVADSSGSGNELSVLYGGGADYIYDTNLGFSRINGLANNFSVKNIGPTLSMWTSTSDPIRSISPAAFTIEATFKLVNGGYRTIVGRESYGTVTAEAALAALYFQAMPENRVSIQFCDVAGYWHQAVSATGAITTFDSTANPTGNGVPWYSMAGVSNGSTLSLYLRNVTAGGAWQLVAQTDLTPSGSTNTALTAGAGDGSDWDAGNWTVGRGLFAGGHTDRASGFIDEVRISTVARTPSELLYCEVPAGNNWMELLNGNLSLSQLSIPGTHDSGARVEPVSGTAKCQDLSITDQLSAGVRFLDIRCRHVDNTFAIHHGSVYQNMNFTDVLNMVVGFLNSNPTECVLMSVKEEYDPSNNTRSFEETFDAYRQLNPEKWYINEAVPTLSQARGRIVLLRRFGAGGLPKGINATNWSDNTTFSINNSLSQLRVQDYYNDSSSSAKWTAILALLTEAPAGGSAVLYINFTSGYKAGLFSIPSIPTISNAINPQIVSYFTSNTAGRFGVIPMDFADAQKATLIMRTNFHIVAAYEVADMNHNGQVDMGDLIMLCNEWLSTSPNEAIDLWPDRVVDMKDFLILSRYWGI
jgi:1-phosphatidylinositol phosphodiesterase